MAAAFQSDAFQNDAFEVSAGSSINAEALPAGLSSASSIGSVTAFGGATVSATGISSTSSIGSVVATGGSSISAFANPAGVTSSSAIGTVAAKGNAVSLPAGLSSSSSIGSASLSGTALKAVVGVSSVSALGTVIASGAGNLSASGVSSISDVGAASVTGNALTNAVGVTSSSTIGQAVASGASVTSAEATPAGVSSSSSIGSVITVADAMFYASGVGTGSAISPLRVQNYAIDWAPLEYVSDSILSASSQIVVSGVHSSSAVGQAVAGEVFLLQPQQAKWIAQIAALHGLIDPLIVSATSRTSSGLVQSVSGTSTVTVTTIDQGNIAFHPDMIEQLAMLHGLTEPLVVTANSRIAGTISQSISTVGAVTTVSML